MVFNYILRKLRLFSFYILTEDSSYCFMKVSKKGTSVSFAWVSPPASKQNYF